MKQTYKHTTFACYMAYVTSAVINNFAPLLFVIFQNQFSLNISQLAVFISLNFGVQLVVDYLGARYADKIGYRRTLIIALSFAALGLFSLGILPIVLPPFVGICASVVLYAIGSGLIEVMVSPTIEAMPNDAKESAMVVLHSFFCWGSVLVIIVSTLFFKFIGQEYWRYLCYLWAILPVVTMILFFKVPIASLNEGAERTSFTKLFSTKIFWAFVVFMMCAGAAELAISQWASYFAETGLGVSKTVGNLLGPCMFAVMMGIGRAMYGAYSEKVDVCTALLGSAAICVVGYLVTVFCKNPVVSLLGCGICGFGVAVMWPGTLSLSSKCCPFGGTAMFGLLAMSGDIGCCVGPSLVAKISSSFSVMGSSIKAGILCSIVFPIVLLLGMFAVRLKMKRNGQL